jgi:hypothetical protein
MDFPQEVIQVIGWIYWPIYSAYQLYPMTSVVLGGLSIVTLLGACLFDGAGRILGVIATLYLWSSYAAIPMMYSSGYFY